MMFQDAVNAAQNLINLVPLLGDSHSRTDYEQAVQLVEHLVENDPDNPLIDMICAKIDAYEKTAPEFAEFNERLANSDSGVAALRTLMDQYHLNTTDFQEELGSRSYVSRILKGERGLTLEHIKKLSARFNIPATIFIGS
ncbi:TPA: helix-turn-helix domain-containing protein [Proteus mirabilis]|uniref:Helix-turn-helix domain-containing protein n=2 Tax=Morganellaceae TaxID=1903414 RepID=A0AAI9HUG3_MORMO|nr:MULTISPECIES: helix-turn-helix domain-containing protein [Providencia]EJV1664992.1 helix-turn-helix domain-containing protein [Klebsiella pneumoniae]EKW8762809.1 helix-turn-helix domain-containing protein [Morganella morganii]HEJ9425865.1 helix-turn-helix domain-containing protein [Proteus mirabilis]ELI9034880.1 helix-turn-helix domain-containing protein [Morganella morganii]ELR5252238.1 helix-turn-helix domain-containing protein [Providencia rettgeri]